jgi:acyl dehydratase
VDPAWLVAYGRVTGLVIGGTLPPAALQATALPLHMAVLTAPAFPLPLIGAVHVRQRIDVLRPIGVSEELALICRVEGARPARRGVEVDLHTEVSSGGDVVWRAVTTFLSRTPGAGAGGGERPDDATPEAPEISAVWRLPEDLGRRFARVAGDRNPIHLTWWTARPFGFKRPIIHGMWTLARCLGSIESKLPREPLRIECRFRRPLPLPGTAEFAAFRDGGVERFVVRDPKGRVALVGHVASLSGVSD